MIKGAAATNCIDSCTHDNVYLNTSSLSYPMKGGKTFLVLSVLFVLSMYVVPFGVLSGVQGWHTFAFWTVASIVYLAIVLLFILRR